MSYVALVFFTSCSVKFHSSLEIETYQEQTEENFIIISENVFEND